MPERRRFSRRADGEPEEMWPAAEAAAVRDHPGQQPASAVGHLLQLSRLEAHSSPSWIENMSFTIETWFERRWTYHCQTRHQLCQTRLAPFPAKVWRHERKVQAEFERERQQDWLIKSLELVGKPNKQQERHNTFRHTKLVCSKCDVSWT